MPGKSANSGKGRQHRMVLLVQGGVKKGSPLLTCYGWEFWDGRFPAKQLARLLRKYGDLQHVIVLSNTKITNLLTPNNSPRFPEIEDDEHGAGWRMIQCKRTTRTNANTGSLGMLWSGRFLACVHLDGDMKVDCVVHLVDGHEVETVEESLDRANCQIVFGLQWFYEEYCDRRRPYG